MGVRDTSPEQESIAKSVFKHFSLNGKQLYAFRLVTWQVMENRLTPLRMYISNCRGTRKTCIILALTEFFKFVSQPQWFCICFYMGVAARNVSRLTLHSALNLSKRRGPRMTTKVTHNLIAKWDSIDFLLIDEASVIRQKMMVSIYEVLCIVKGSDFLFKGMNIIFARDFAQSPPMAQSVLYRCSVERKISDLRVQSEIFGRLLWLLVDVIMLLIESMRQARKENKRFVELLN